LSFSFLFVQPFCLALWKKKEKKERTRSAERAVGELFAMVARTKVLMSGAACVYVDREKYVETPRQPIRGSLRGATKLHFLLSKNNNKE